jgi:cytochrome c
MNYSLSVGVVVVVTLALSPAWAAEDSVARGEHLFGTCAACHSLQPNRNMTGPSLSAIWNRKAGTLPSFHRYSPAMKSADVVWNDQTLDEWLKDTQHLIPGNTMTFPGIKDPRQRADLLAFLKNATQPGRVPSTSAQGDSRMGGMGGMMGGGDVPNLKTLDPEDHVREIAHCGDTYKVITEDGKSREFWERNLRFKTDTSDEGPQKGAPAIVPAGMMGDRADVIFASPEEISSAINNRC